MVRQNDTNIVNSTRIQPRIADLIATVKKHSRSVARSAHSTFKVGPLHLPSDSRSFTHERLGSYKSPLCGWKLR
jgi:hypothetical protein